jgi:hypothetical protein
MLIKEAGEQQQQQRRDKAMKAYEDPKSEGNGPKYHSGLHCDVEGCNEPAGTAWSPYWCQKHNAERMNRIDASLNKMMATFEKKQEPRP